VILHLPISRLGARRLHVHQEALRTLRQGQQALDTSGMRLDQMFQFCLERGLMSSARAA